MKAAAGGPCGFRGLAGGFGVQLPFLEDPNTGRAVSGGPAVRAYLFAQYATGDVVDSSFADYSTKGMQEGHGSMPGAAKVN